MSQRTRRPSPALIVASTALVFALTGAAVALPGKGSVDKNDLAKGAVTKKAIKKGAVTAKAIKPGAVDGSKVAVDSLSGANINESTLGTVPSAAKVDNVTLVGRTSDAEEGAAPLLATSGPFTIRLECQSASSGTTVGLVLIESQEAGSAFSNPFSTHLVDPGDPESDRTVQTVIDGAGAPLSIGLSGTGQFTAAAPSGHTIMGSFNQVVDAEAGGGTCTAFGQVTRLG